MFISLFLIILFISITICKYKICILKNVKHKQNLQIIL